MISSPSLSSPSSTLFFESIDLPRSRSSFSSSSSRISCCSRNYSSIPKLEDFSRSSDITRWLKQPSLIEKTKKELTDYCTTLEGDSCSNCWRAFFEMEDLEKVLSKEDVEGIIVNSSGLKSLIHWIHRMSMIFQKKINQQKIESSLKRAEEEEKKKEHEHVHAHIPDGLPKTREEIEEEEEENAKLPESSFTRVLKTMGGFPAWYISRPDHETD